MLFFLFSCSYENHENFTFSTWVGAGKEFKEDLWLKKLNYYDSLGISEILVGGSADILSKIIRLAKKKNIKVHGWMWTLNRPGDTIANKNPDWYAVNRNGQNSLEYRAYVDYYQWLSPFHPEAREHIINNAIKIPDDSSAKITMDGLLGSNYISIEPGGSEIYLNENDKQLIEYVIL